MQLTTAQTDRAAGVLLGQAVGDALGVPYEFATAPGRHERAEMRGGGLGRYAPGEWSDDTQMAVCIGDVAAEGHDLTTPGALDRIATSFVRWYRWGPSDIGLQTSAVLGSAARTLATDPQHASGILTSAAEQYSRHHQRSAGNGALMRTSGVALASLDDRDRTAEAASSIARLTHYDELAADSCVLWSEAIRVAVLEARFDFHAGIDLIPAARRSRWSGWVDDALTLPPSTFTPNGFTVTALQAAVAAIAQTEVPDDDPAQAGFACLHLQDALHAAIRIGHDTDTVAAIAGGLLGARWGASAVPWHWRRKVHGWPGRRARDLVALGTTAVHGGRDDDQGWPTCERMRYDEPASTSVVPHPLDDQVLLGTMRSTDHDATAVVSMCRVGTRDHDRIDEENRVESRLMDSDDATSNPNLGFALLDVADAIRGLRAEGHTVLVHCVAAHQRTPSAAVAFAVLQGHDPTEAQRAVRAALVSTRGSGRVWEAAARVRDGR